jgi:hypothetical protein
MSRLRLFALLFLYLGAAASFTACGDDKKKKSDDDDDGGSSSKKKGSESSFYEETCRDVVEKGPGPEWMGGGTIEECVEGLKVYSDEKAIWYRECVDNAVTAGSPEDIHWCNIDLSSWDSEPEGSEPEEEEFLGSPAMMGLSEDETWADWRSAGTYDLAIPERAGPFWVVAVQAGSNKKSAEKKADELRKLDLPTHTAWLGSYGSAKNKALWLTYVGPYAYSERLDARETLLMMLREVGSDYYAVTLGPAGTRETIDIH